MPLHLPSFLQQCPRRRPKLHRFPFHPSLFQRQRANYLARCPGTIHMIGTDCKFGSSCVCLIGFFGVGPTCVSFCAPLYSESKGVGSLAPHRPTTTNPASYFRLFFPVTMIQILTYPFPLLLFYNLLSFLAHLWLAFTADFAITTCKHPIRYFSTTNFVGGYLWPPENIVLLYLPITVICTVQQIHLAWRTMLLFWPLRVRNTGNTNSRCGRSQNRRGCAVSVEKVFSPSPATPIFP